MSFEPTKVVKMDKGKQVGDTLMQDASTIPYNNTTVGAELTTINNNLPNKPNYCIRTFNLGSVTSGTKTAVATTFELTNGATSDYTKIVGCTVISAGGNNTNNIGIAINRNVDSEYWLIVPTESDTNFNVRVATLYVD